MRNLIAAPVLWKNPGTADFQGSVPNGSVRWFVNDSDNLSAAPTAQNGWFRIPLNGADRLELQFIGRVVDITGTTGAVTGTSTTLVALGLPYEEDWASPFPAASTSAPATNLLTHPLLLAAPPTGAVTADQRNFCLMARVITNSAIQGGLNTYVLAESHGVEMIPDTCLFYENSTPADGGLCLWGIEIGRPAYSVGQLVAAKFTPAGSAPFYTLTTEGLDVVYVSLACINSWTTAAPTNLRYRGVLRACLYGPDNVRRTTFAKVRPF